MPTVIIKQRPATVRHCLVVTSKERRFLADIFLYCTERRALQQCLKQWFSSVNLFQPGAPRPTTQAEFQDQYDRVHRALSDTVNAPGNVNHTLIVAGGVELCVLLEVTVGQIERYSLEQKRRTKTTTLRQYCWHFIGPMLAVPKSCFSGDLSQVGATERQRKIKQRQEAKANKDEWGGSTNGGTSEAGDTSGEKDELLVGFDDGSAISRSSLLRLCQWGDLPADDVNSRRSSTGGGLPRVMEEAEVTFSRSGLYDENTAVLFGPAALGGTSVPHGSRSVSVLTSEDNGAGGRSGGGGVHVSGPSTISPSVVSGQPSIYFNKRGTGGSVLSEGTQYKYFFGGAGRVAEVSSRLDVRFTQENAMNDFLAVATGTKIKKPTAAGSQGPSTQPAAFLSFISHMLERVEAEEYEPLAAEVRRRNAKTARSQARLATAGIGGSSDPPEFYGGGRYRDDVIEKVKSLCKGHQRFGPAVFQSDEILRAAGARVALSLDDCTSEEAIKSALANRWKTHLNRDVVNQIFAFASAMALEGYVLPDTTPEYKWVASHTNDAPWRSITGNAGRSSGLRVTVMRSHACTLLETREGIVLIDSGDEATFRKYVWPYLKDKTHLLKLVVATQPSMDKIGGLVLLYRHLHRTMTQGCGKSNASTCSSVFSPSSSSRKYYGRKKDVSLEENSSLSTLSVPPLLMRDYLTTNAPVSYAQPQGVIAAQELVAIARDLGVLIQPELYSGANASATSPRSPTSKDAAQKGTGKPINAAGLQLTPFTTGQDGPSYSASYTVYHRATDSRLLIASSPYYDDVLSKIPTSKKVPTTTNSKLAPATPRGTSTPRGASVTSAGSPRGGSIGSTAASPLQRRAAAPATTTVELPPFDLALVPPVSQSLLTNALTELSLSMGRDSSSGSPAAATKARSVGTPRTMTYTKPKASAGNPMLDMIPMAAVYVGNDVPFPTNLISSYCSVTRHSAAYCFETPQDRFQTLPQDDELGHAGCSGEYDDPDYYMDQDEEDYHQTPTPKNPHRGAAGSPGLDLRLPQGKNQAHQVPLNCAGVCWTLSSAVDSDPNSHYEPTYLPMTNTIEKKSTLKGRKASPGNVSPRGRRTVSPVRATPRSMDKPKPKVAANTKPERKRFAGLDAFTDVKKKEEKEKQQAQLGSGGILKKKKETSPVEAAPKVASLTRFQDPAAGAEIPVRRSPTRVGEAIKADPGRGQLTQTPMSDASSGGKVSNGSAPRPVYGSRVQTDYGRGSQSRTPVSDVSSN